MGFCRSPASCPPHEDWIPTTGDIAELIVFLGFGGRMITGQTIAVDGDISI